MNGFKVPGWLIALIASAVALIAFGMRIQQARQVTDDRSIENRERIEKLEIWLAKVDSIVAYHVRWADQRSLEITRGIESEQRWRCLHYWNDVVVRRELVLAEIDCGRLLGNKLQSGGSGR